MKKHERMKVCECFPLRNKGKSFVGRKKRQGELREGVGAGDVGQLRVWQFQEEV